MRFRHGDGSIVHLGYCARAHPADDLDGLIAGLEGCASLVRKELDVPVLGVGLWLASPLADRLANSPVALNKLRRTLYRNNLEVVSLDGLQHSCFTDKFVGTKLYRPDWTELERLRYTFDLIDVLADLLPKDASYGSVSTLPLAWRVPWSKMHNIAARAAFERLENYLARTEIRTGRRIRMAVEPEPGCVLEMIPQAAAWLSRYSSPYDGLSRVGLCLDTCNLAVQFEEPTDAFGTLWRAGIELVKSQLAVAAQLADPSDSTGRRRLMDLGEPKYLRPVREWGGPGVDDVQQAHELSGHAAWRTHVHVPVHTAPPAPFTSTIAVLDDCLARLVGGSHPLTHHLESETLAWPRKPKSQQELAEWIAADLSWLRDRLIALGLEEITS